MRTARLVAGRGLLPAQVHARLTAQADMDELWHRADVIIDNSGSLEQLRARIDRLLEEHLPA